MNLVARALRRGGPRRSRWTLVAGGVVLVVVLASVVLLRPEPKPYMPGTEAATSDEITRSLVRPLPPEVPRIPFTDAAAEAGVRFQHFHGTRSHQLPEDMGSGAAWGDYDADGDPDLFLVNESGPLTLTEAETAASPARAALYRNDGGGSFTDVTTEAGLAVNGLGMGAAWVDYDGEGDLDLFVSRYGTNLLFRNDAGRFTDVSEASRVSRPQGFWTGVSSADYDRDGDADLYVCGYVRYHWEADLASRTSLQYRAVVPFTLNPSTYEPERNLLLRNDGGVFREVAREAGVDNLTGRSLSASWCDFDGDGWSDLYVANDVSDNAMYRNLGNGRFQDVSHSAWVADHRGAMGLGIGDPDDDGDFDIFITHWIAQENGYYLNMKGEIAAGASEPMHFVDQADVAGLGQIALDFIGWGTDFLDYDNDGRLDLFVVNGSTFQRDDDPARLIPMRNQLFWSAGAREGFHEVGEAIGGVFDIENVGRGAAVADYDGDGDLDAVVVVNGEQARLLRNDGGSAKGWLRVVLRGPLARGRGGPAPARRAGAAALATSTFATGALVRLRAGGSSQIRSVGGSSSYLGQNPPGEVHFGVGAVERIESIEILWPDGTRQEIRDVPARSTVSVTEGKEPEIRTALSPGARP